MFLANFNDSAAASISPLIARDSAAMTGFLTTLALFWFLMIGVGFIFKKLSALSGLGPIDKVLGFIFGASKFFLIAAVIAYASYSIHAIKATIDSNMKSSMLFPILVETGSFIMKLDPTEISNDINATLQNQVTESVNTATQNIVNETKKEIKEAMPQVAKDAKMIKDGK